MRQSLRQELGLTDPLSLELPDVSLEQQLAGGDAPLTPEEEQSLLGRLAGGAEYIGESIEKPGYAVRGLLTGKPDALLNLIPFYDTVQQSGVGQSLGMPEAPKVSGWDLAEAYGAGPNEPGFDAGDIPKWGLELLTNPLTFASALPKVGVKAGLEAAKLAGEAGKAASMGEKIGSAVEGITRGVKPLTQTPTVIADQIRAGERAVAGFGLPFMEPAVTFGQGSERAAKAIEAIGYSKPVAFARGMFSHVPGVGGMFDPTYQRMADKAWVEAEGKIGALMDAKPVFDQGMKAFDDAATSAAEALGKQGDAEVMAQLRDLPRVLKSIPNEIGGVPDPEGIARRMGDILGAASDKPLPEALQHIANAGDHFTALFDGMQKAEDSLHALAVKYGAKIGTLDDPTERHTFRWMNDVANKAGVSQKGKTVPLTGLESSYRPETRRAWLRLYPQSTRYVNEIVRNQDFTGRILQDTGEVVQLSAKDHAATLAKVLEGMGVAVPEKASRIELQRLYLQQKLEPILDDSVRSGLLDEGKRSEWWNKLFGKKVVETTGPETSTVTRGVNRAPLPSEIARDSMGAIPIDSAAAAKLGRVTQGKFGTLGVDDIIGGIMKLPKETVNTGVWDKNVVQEFFNYSNYLVEKIYNARTMHNFLSQPGVVEEAATATRAGTPLLKAWRHTGLSDKGLENLVGTIAKGIPEGEDALKLASKYQITDDGVRVLNTFRQLQQPETVGKLGQMWDNTQKYIKSYLTIPRFSFHARNLASGTYQNIADGMVGPLDLFREIGNAFKQAHTGKQHLQFLDEFVSSGGLTSGVMKDIDALRAANQAVPSGLFGGAEKPLMNALFHPVQTFKEGGFNPFNLGSDVKKANVALESGGKLYGLVEYVNRASYYEALRKAGHSPSEALHYVNRSQFNYSKSSPWERSVAKKLVPFYSWVRNNLPLQLTRIVERPLGGVTGVTLKATKDLSSGDSEFTPDFLREGLGIKLPGGTPQATAFLKQAGLPIEDLNRVVFRDGLPDPVRTAQKTMAMMSPLLLAPIEGATNTQMYTGRKLSDLQSVTGIPTLDSIIHYSPASALASEAYSAIDPRKSWDQRLLNAMTGLKVGTYDAEKMKLRALQQAQQEVLTDNPKIGEMSLPYIKPQYKGQEGSADTEAQMKVLNRLNRSLRSLKKRRESAGLTT
jgi:hypothetical protein